jgi:hypothetical protein
MFVPSLFVGSEMFFVRVNRFWCVWIRVLVFVWRKPSGDGSVFAAMGCLTWGVV